MTWKNQIKKFTPRAIANKHKFDDVFMVEIREALENLIDNFPLDVISQKDMDALEASDDEIILLALEKEARAELERMLEYGETAKY
tara:strand:- start:218 stop:475 length:258 start_codon:yes stop_codon:yes gene_type:complete